MLRGMGAACSSAAMSEEQRAASAILDTGWDPMAEPAKVSSCGGKQRCHCFGN